MNQFSTVTEKKHGERKPVQSEKYRKAEAGQQF